MKPVFGAREKDLLNRIGERFGFTPRREVTPETPYPWLASYPDKIDWSQTISRKPLHRFMDEAVERFGDNPSVNSLGKSYSYQEIGDLVNKVAKGFNPHFPNDHAFN